MTLHQVTKKYRAELKQHEAAHEQSLRAVHATALAVILAELRHFYQQMEQGPVSLVWLHEYNRLQSLERTIQYSLDQFGMTAQVIAQQAHHKAVQLGVQSANAQMEANKVPEEDTNYVTPIFFMTGKRAKTFQGYGKEAAKRVRQIVTVGVSLGWGVKRIASHVNDILNIPLWRAIVGVGEAMMDAYRSTVSDVMGANSDIIIGWYWVAMLGSCCMACLEMHGSFHAVNEDLVSHVHCQCQQEFVTAQDARQSGEDWFNEQDYDTQEEMMGPGKYDAYLKGKFELSDLVSYTTSPIWGKSMRETPLKELVH